MNQPIDSRSDEELLAADVLLLVDPDEPGWQQLLWSAAIDDDAANSATMEIVEIAVDSRDERQVEAAHARVSRLKGSGQSGS
jgi:hypothetical protein